MKFKFKKNKKQQFFNVFLGFFWILYGIFGLLSKNYRTFDFISIFIGIAYIGFYFLDKKEQYLIITDDEIKEDYLFGKSIKTDTIKKISEFAGDIIIKTHSKELVIHKQSFDYDTFTNIKLEIEGLKMKLNID